MKSYQPYSDGQLVRLIAQGDRAAFDTLYERYRVSAIDQAYRRTRDREASEDIVQNIFLKIWVNRKEDIQNFEAFLRRSVRNAVFNWLDAQSVKHRYFEPFRQVRLEEVEDSAFTTRLAEKDLAALILSYAQSLPEQRRRIFLLYAQDRLEAQEIAEQLGISVKTVRNSIRIAILDLQEKIGPAALVILVHLAADLFIKK